MACDPTNRPKFKWMQRRSNEVSQVDLYTAELKGVMNRWNGKYLVTGVNKVVSILRSHPESYKTFIRLYFDVIGGYVIEPARRHNDTEYSNPIIEVHTTFLSKILKACRMEVSRDPSTANDTLAGDLEALIYKTTCQKLLEVFHDPNFEHIKNGTYFVMMGKSAQAQILPVDVFRLICLVIARESQTDQQHLVVSELVQSGWKVLDHTVKTILVEHFKLVFPTLTGKAKALYQDIICTFETELSREYRSSPTKSQQVPSLT